MPCQFVDSLCCFMSPFISCVPVSHHVLLHSASSRLLYCLRATPLRDVRRTASMTYCFSSWVPMLLTCCYSAWNSMLLTSCFTSWVPILLTCCSYAWNAMLLTWRFTSWDPILLTCCSYAWNAMLLTCSFTSRVPVLLTFVLLCEFQVVASLLDTTPFISCSTLWAAAIYTLLNVFFFCEEWNVIYKPCWWMSRILNCGSFHYSRKNLPVCVTISVTIFVVIPCMLSSLSIILQTTALI